MVKNYLNKYLLFLVTIACLFASPVFADESNSSLFVKITDAKTAVTKNDQETAKNLIEEIKTEFETNPQHDSKAGKEVAQSLNISGTITEEKLTKMTSALLAFEKEQNPVDVNAEKKQLVKNLSSVFDNLQIAITSKDLDATRKAFKEMNSTWTSNESIVRDNSTVYYGKIETAISFLRSSIETEPTDFATIQTSFDDLKTAINNFVEGQKVEDSSENYTLKDGIQLLENALKQFQSGDTKKAMANMKQFITIWPTIEADVSIHNPSLYTRVESQSPVIMVKGSEEKYQKQLQTLISDLSQIDTTANYNFFDAMLILLREGVEALLIVMALVTTLKASNIRKGLKWVYSGAAIGVLASAVIAVVFQSVFPAVASGSNREIIEGGVGIFAVAMMILVGIWLHSKSSVQKWNQFMKDKMKVVTATGSFVSMFALSFLAVFREGAETILFYAGILPKITLTDFLIGIGAAIVVLIAIAILMTKASSYFKPYRIFFWLTWLIYALAFKMLGVSIHALQLTNILPSHLINNFPTIDWAGVYPNVEVVVGQFILLVIVVLITLKNRESKHG